MYGTPTSAAIFAMRSAMERAWASDSMTQGPATKKSGLSPPRRREPREISRVVAICQLKISQAKLAPSRWAVSVSAGVEKQSVRCRGATGGRCGVARLRSCQHHEVWKEERGHRRGSID